jgi:hypothetical protein
MEKAIGEIEGWLKKIGAREVGDGEIGVKPSLPSCWDGNA